MQDFTRGGYFSIDGGSAPLAYFNPLSSGDSGDWGGKTTNDSYLAFSNPGVFNDISPADLIVMDVLGFHGYADDYGEDVNFAWHVSVGSSVQGSIELSADADWFRVPLTAGVHYAIKLSGADGGGGTLADPFLGIWNSSSPLTSGYYYLAASSAIGAATGSYTLSVNVAPKVFNPDILPVDSVADVALPHLPAFLGGDHLRPKCRSANQVGRALLVRGPFRCKATMSIAPLGHGAGLIAMSAEPPPM